MYVSYRMTIDVKDRNWRCPPIIVNTRYMARSSGTIGRIDGGTVTYMLHVDLVEIRVVILALLSGF